MRTTPRGILILKQSQQTRNSGPEVGHDIFLLELFSYWTTVSLDCFSRKNTIGVVGYQAISLIQQFLERQREIDAHFFSRILHFSSPSGQIVVYSCLITMKCTDDMLQRAMIPIQRVRKISRYGICHCRKVFADYWRNWMHDHHFGKGCHRSHNYWNVT